MICIAAEQIYAAMAKNRYFLIVLITQPIWKLGLNGKLTSTLAKNESQIHLFYREALRYKSFMSAESRFFNHIGN